MYRRLWVDTDTVRLPAEEDGRVRPRLGAVVRADGEAIGTIWVVQGDRAFDPGAETALTDSTRRAALLLLQHQEAGDIERRRRADAMRIALDTGAPLPVDLGDDERIRVVAFRTATAGPVDAAARVVRRQRLVDLVAMQLELVDDRSAAVDTGEVVLALLPEAATISTRRQRETVTGIVQRASHALKTEVIAGIGGAATAPAALATARWEAEQVSAVLADDPPTDRQSQVASIDDVRAAVVMRRVRQMLAGDERCHTPHLDLLAQHDALHNSDHLATLGAYLDSFGDVAGAARRLDIHPNTLRYRLKRIVELLGVDLADPITRFTIELQWRLR
jgi:sugar diacid utilization regulator